MNISFVGHLPCFAWLHNSGIARLFQLLGSSSLRCVGGCVRDSLLGLPLKDVDCATPLAPEEVLQLLQAGGIATYIQGQGLRHGSIGCVIEGHTYDITTLRRDVLTDGRHAIISPTSSWQEDHKRRDFRMNGLYLDAEGKLYDFDQGKQDCLEGRVSFIGDPFQRVQEDYLRILRFFRFYSLYGRVPLDFQGLQACRQQAAGLRQISRQRIKSELFKILAAPQAAETLRLMDQWGVLHQILPGANLELLLRMWQRQHQINGDGEIDTLVAAVVLAGKPLDTLFPLSRHEAKRAKVFYQAWQLFADKPAQGPLFQPGLMTPEIQTHNVHKALLGLNAAYSHPWDAEIAAHVAEQVALSQQSFPLKPGDMYHQGYRGLKVHQMWLSVHHWWAQHNPRPSREACLEQSERLGLQLREVPNPEEIQPKSQEGGV